MKAIAYCGIDCSQCLIYQASTEDDLRKKREIIKSWSTKKFPLTMYNVECFGCKGDKTVNFCGKCDIRICAKNKNLNSCAFCQEFPCHMIGKVFEKNPDALERLQILKKTEE
ncbi:MAG: DUF3795 domain-containing protein [Bacteroidota bacterium]